VGRRCHLLAEMASSFLLFCLTNPAQGSYRENQSRGLSIILSEAYIKYNVYGHTGKYREGKKDKIKIVSHVSTQGKNTVIAKAVGLSGVTIYN
jgi:hypothetical protein